MNKNEFLFNNKFIDEKSLRPKKFNQYIGQDKIKKELFIYIKAAKNRKSILDHILLYGPPGLGKTTLADIISNEMNVKLKIISGPIIERPGDLLSILNELNTGDVLFIDEIHRLSNNIEEMLYSIMEDFFIDIIIGHDISSQSVHFNIKHFTLIGATTKAGKISSALRDRFGIVCRLSYYNINDLKKIIIRSSKILKIVISEEGALEIAKCSRGTPRIANRLLKRIRDFANVKFDNFIDKKVVKNTLELLQVDKLGLDFIDQKIIKIMIEDYKGGPVGLNTIAINIGEEKTTIEDMYEPFLIKKGFLKRTSRGRVATIKAYKYFGYIN